GGGARGSRAPLADRRPERARRLAREPRRRGGGGASRSGALAGVLRLGTRRRTGGSPPGLRLRMAPRTGALAGGKRQLLGGAPRLVHGPLRAHARRRGGGRPAPPRAALGCFAPVPDQRRAPRRASGHPAPPRL